MKEGQDSYLIELINEEIKLFQNETHEALDKMLLDLTIDYMWSLNTTLLPDKITQS